MDYDTMIAVLRAGGVDVDTFDSQSAKKLSDLHQEIKNKDVVLELHKGRACRIALTVKILIIVNSIDYVRQLKRVYPSGKEVVRSGSASISETRMRGECAFDAVVRGLHEECGIVITHDDIRIPSPFQHQFLKENYGFSDLLPQIDEHESSVYTGVLTIGHVELYEVHLREKPWPEDTRIIDDNGVKIHLVYWRLPNPAFFDQHLRALPE